MSYKSVFYCSLAFPAVQHHEAKISSTQLCLQVGHGVGQYMEGVGLWLGKLLNTVIGHIQGE